MKYNIVTLIIVVTSFSCKNIEKMIDKGEYDKAIDYAISKLEGQKNKKTKHVKALEKAYHKINQRDSRKIESLKLQEKDFKFDKIHDIYITLNARQEKILKLHPLTSEDGYLADFKLKNYNKVISNMSLKATEDHYKKSQYLLQLANKDDKYAAREAFERLSYIKKYTDNYRDTDVLIHEAVRLGTDHILITFNNKSYDYTRGDFQDIIYDIDLLSLNNLWTKYYIDNNSYDMDYIVSIEINDIVAGYEKENAIRYSESKQVEDGVKKVVDVNGNIVKDSIGQIVLTTRYKTVSAEITELTRYKEAHITGKTVIYNNVSNTKIKVIPFELNHVFEDYSAIYTGDKEALTNKTKNRLKSNCLYFPSDYDMVMSLAYPLKESLYETLKEI